MVFMRMRDDQRVQAVQDRLQELRVRNDRFDGVLIVVGKGDTGINEHPSTVVSV